MIMVESIDDKANMQIRNAVFNGADDEIIAILKDYLIAHPVKEELLPIIDGRRLSQQDVIEEMQKKTNLGMAYVFAIKEQYLFQQS